MNTRPAVGLVDCAALIGWSVRTAERALAEGTFPVPHLPRRRRQRGSPYRFSSYEIDRYLQDASTADARVRGR